MTSQTFTVRGMSCEHCVHAVTEEVEKLPGVQTVQVDLGTGVVTVDADGLLSASDVAAAIDEAGYELVA
jgi:copper ion binding protein